MQHAFNIFLKGAQNNHHRYSKKLHYFCSYILLDVLKSSLLRAVFTLRNRKMSADTRSGEYDG